MNVLLPVLLIGLLFLGGTACGQGISNGGTRRTVFRERGGKGSSYTKAIVIHARDWESGIPKEYQYLSSHFPGSKSISHTRQLYTHYTYDIVTFTTADGKKRALYFSYRVTHE